MPGWSCDPSLTGNLCFHSTLWLSTTKGQPASMSLSVVKDGRISCPPQLCLMHSWPWDSTLHSAGPALWLLGTKTSSSQRRWQAEVLHGRFHVVRATVRQALATLGAVGGSSIHPGHLGDGSGYQLGNILVHHGDQPHSSQKHHLPASYFFLAFVSQPSSFCNVLFFP